MKKYIVVGGIIVAVALLVAAGRYFAWFGDAPNQGTIGQANPENETETNTENDPETPEAVAYVVETVASNLFVPWSLVFTNENRLLVTERNGKLRVIENGKLLEKPLAEFAEVATGGEEGLMGLAADPDYGSNKTLYTCLAYRNGATYRDKVISFRDNGDSIDTVKTIIDNIPSATNHAGCRLMFLPDKTLLITTGDATDRNIAQDKNSLGGKILRLNRDGSIPGDNPFSNSPIWSFGHRNSQGLAYDTEHDILWATEHGPSIFDGPAGGDEINLIEKGQNYGWPTIHHKQKQAGLISPLLEFTPAVAPSGMLYYSATALPQFTGNLFFAALKGEGLYRLTIDPKDARRITAFEKLKDVNVGRIRDVVQGSDGAIYFATSNRDGRGKLRAQDDKIYRLIAR